MDTPYKTHMAGLKKERKEKEGRYKKERSASKTIDVNAKLKNNAGTLSMLNYVNLSNVDKRKLEHARKEDLFHLDPKLTNWLLKPKEIDERFASIDPKRMNAFQNAMNKCKETIVINVNSQLHLSETDAGTRDDTEQYYRKRAMKQLRCSNREKLEKHNRLELNLEAAKISFVNASPRRCSSLSSIPSVVQYTDKKTNDVDELQAIQNLSFQSILELPTARLKRVICKIIDDMKIKSKHTGQEKECPTGSDIYPSQLSANNIHYRRLPITAKDVPLIKRNSKNPSSMVYSCKSSTNLPMAPARETKDEKSLPPSEATNRRIPSVEPKLLGHSLIGISRVAVPCPVTMCRAVVGMTSLLTHILRDHQMIGNDMDIHIKEVYANERHRLVFTPFGLSFRNTVCLGALAFAGRRGGKTPAKRRLCRDNKFLPPKYEVWKNHLPILVMLCKTTMAAFAGNAMLEDKVMQSNNEQFNVYILWLISTQTVKPILATVTVCDSSLSQSRSQVLRCRGLHKSQNLAEFITKESDYIHMMPAEFNKMTSYGKHKVILEITIHSYDKK